MCWWLGMTLRSVSYHHSYVSSIYHGHDTNEYAKSQLSDTTVTSRTTSTRGFLCLLWTKASDTDKFPKITMLAGIPPTNGQLPSARCIRGEPARLVPTAAERLFARGLHSRQVRAEEVHRQRMGSPTHAEGQLVRFHFQLELVKNTPARATAMDGSLEVPVPSTTWHMEEHLGV